MIQLNSTDLFYTIKNAQDAGVLELLPAMKGRIQPGDRFFESFQMYLLETYDLEVLDKVFFNLAPTIAYMAQSSNWEPEDFTSTELYSAIKNLQKMQVFEIKNETLDLPGSGDRFFEYYQEILVNKIGVDQIDRVLHIFGKCIKFLATDAALVNL